MENAQGFLNSRQQTFDLINTTMLLAFVLISTVFLNIKLPNRGECI